jgi:surfactin synthase thioesterase subunit
MAHIGAYDKTAVWFAGLAPNQAAEARLFCFPYAGLGTSAYRGWAGAFGSALDVCPVQLPGRESRHHEPPFRRMDDLLDAVLEALAPYCDVPCAIVGHSLGAVIAYELARRLPASTDLRRVFVSARRAPHLPDRQPAISHLADAQFLAEVQRRYAGIPTAILEAPDLLQLLLPRLRADLELLETHAHRSGDPLRCAISVFGGLQDPTVTRTELDAWSVHSASGVRLRMVPGPHLFLQEQRSALLTAVAEDLGLPGAAPRARA